MRPCRFRKAHDLAAENAEARRATVELLALLEQRLVADADAEERPARLDELARGLQQFLLSQGMDAIVKRAHAGQHDRARVVHPFGPLHDAHVRADLEQRLVDAAQVAGAVIEEGDHENPSMNLMPSAWSAPKS